MKTSYETLTLSRRNFFSLIGGGAAIAVLPAIVLAEPTTVVPVEFGWTWFIDKANVPAPLVDTVFKTMQANAQNIYDNTFKDKQLVTKLDGQIVRFDLDYITEQQQNDRMIERLQRNHKVREEARIDKILNRTNWSAKDAEWLKTKSERALRNEPLYITEHVRSNPDESITYFADNSFTVPLYNVKWEKVGNKHVRVVKCYGHNGDITWV